MGSEFHGLPDDVTPRTNAEAVFLAQVVPAIPRLDVWPHELPDQQPWLLLSVDIVTDGQLVGVPRLDFFGDVIRGGYSTADLNWDDGVTALQAGIDFRASFGIELQGEPDELATAAVGWFQDRMDKWRSELMRTR